jgi:hypothetical protein
VHGRLNPQKAVQILRDLRALRALRAEASEAAAETNKEEK